MYFSLHLQFPSCFAHICWTSFSFLVSFLKKKKEEEGKFRNEHEYSHLLDLEMEEYFSLLQVSIGKRVCPWIAWTDCFHSKLSCDISWVKTVREVLLSVAGFLFLLALEVNAHYISTIHWSFNQCPACLVRIAPGWCPRPGHGQHLFVPLTRMRHDSTGLANNYMLWTDQFSQFTVQSKLILQNKGFCQQGATWESSMPM